MRIKAAIIIVLIFGGIFAANLLIDNRKLSSIELENVRAACFTCHSSVPFYEQASKVHDTHAALDCSYCHSENRPLKPSTGPTPELSPLPIRIPPDIPHALVGRENCLTCHGTSGGYAQQIPADHVGRTNETCTGCHTVSK
jgi:hypothetical protein